MRLKNKKTGRERDERIVAEAMAEYVMRNPNHQYPGLRETICYNKLRRINETQE